MPARRKRLWKAFTRKSASIRSRARNSNPKGGAPSYTHNANDGYLGGPNVFGFRPTYNYVTICVGGVCETNWVLSGYEWIFRSGAYAV